MVLSAEKSWFSLVLVPDSGEASSDSGSESRVYSSGGHGIGIESSPGRVLMQNVYCDIIFFV